MKEKALKIINNYGVMPQLKHFQSEVFELNEAIISNQFIASDYGISANKESIKHIAEEIADVMVMLYEFKEYYKISNEEIIDVMQYKINRQLKRMEEEANANK